MASVRLPSQVGTSSLWSLARVAFALAPGVVFSVAGVTGEGRSLWLVPGLFLVVYALLQVRHAWRSRPSDALIDEHGVRFEGGRQHGAQFAFSDLDASGTTVETVREPRLTFELVLAFVVFRLLSSDRESMPDTRVPVRRLTLAPRDGRRLQLAEAEHPDEQRSLDALFGTLQAKIASLADAPPALHGPAHVLSCAGCGAPLSIPESEQVCCRHCGRWTPVPVELRERVQAKAHVKRAHGDIEANVRALLSQPGARFASFILLLALVFCGVGWLVVLGGLALTGLGDIGGFDVGWALFAGVAWSLFALLLARGAFAKRRALTLLASAFGARAPAAPGQPSACRCCGAGLAETQSLVSVCGYCGADNVLGIDLRPAVRPLREHALGLEALLTQRRREVRNALLGAAGSFVALGVAALMTVISVSVALEFAQVKRDCRANQARACRELGTDYSLGISGSEDDDKALEAWERGCELGDAEACYSAGRALDWGIDVPEDKERGAALIEKACKLGHAEACKPE